MDGADNPEKETRRRKIAILTPVQRSVEADFTASLVRTIAALKSQADIGWLHVVGHANLPRARNILVGKALAHGFDDIVFIDSDIGWSPDAFARLFNVPDEAGIVAGAPQRRIKDQTSFCASVPAGPTRALGDLVEGYAATAFLRIRREVFDFLADKVQEFEYRDEFFRAFFNYRIDKNPSGKTVGFIGEDFYFCMLAKENGLDVWIDPKIELRHWNNAPLTEVMGDHVFVKPSSLPEHEPQKSEA